MRVGQGVYAQTSSRRYPDWVYGHSRSWSAGAETKAGGAVAQERKALEGDSNAQVTAPAQRGPQQRQLNMAGRTPIATSCPGIRQAQTHSTNPALCDLHEQALAGEAGSMQRKHPEQEIW